MRGMINEFFQHKGKYPRLKDLLKSVNNGKVSSEQHDLMMNGGMPPGPLLYDG